MLVASVFVNIPVKSIAKAFTYRVPEELAEIDVGWRVFVPFGHRKVEGFVLAKKNLSEDEVAQMKFELKDIIRPVDDESWFTPEMIELAKWLSEFYLCSLAEMMRLFMPGKSGLKITVRYMANEKEQDHILLGMPQYKEVYQYLRQNGPQKKSEIAKALPELREQLNDILASLFRYHVIVKDYEASERDKGRYERQVHLLKNVTPELLADYQKHRKAQAAALQVLQALPQQTTSVENLKAQKISLATINKLAADGLVEIFAQRVLRDSYKDAVVPQQKQITLTEAQQQAIAAMTPLVKENKFQGFLLKGITGSGKTQVYIEMAKVVRQQGRQVIVLVPEISLTGQVVMAFKAYFPDDIVVMHSRLSLAERNDAILRVRRHEAGIIIGARSALFTPASDIGMIIMDEEQDMSYKQDESPRYHARVVAEKMAQIHQAVLLLGSATPSLETYYRARKGELQLLLLPERIGGMPLPKVQSVDMRAELKHGNRHILSRALQTLIEQTIAQKQQVIIMLNRRGFSTFVMCRSCGEVIKCPDCGMPLVYHKDGSLLCHHCDRREEVPTVCPKCGSRYIKYFGSGTEKLEQELHTLVPSARVIRMDRDTTTSKFAHQEILDKFRRHEYDILLGTQMVAKGHDIPNVTAVGVISADSSLNMPDFRAAERCFMLITQTAGRAGRGDIPGHVVIQTYNPEHYAVKAGIAQDYEAFCKTELSMRKGLFYPPYSRLIKLMFQHTEEKTAKNNAELFVQLFKKRFAKNKDQIAIGPSPALIARFRGIYRFIVLIKSADLKAAQDFLRELNLHLRTDIAIDVDPISMF